MKKRKEGSWKKRIRDHYRLVILNDESLKEVSSFKLNLLNLYILLSTLLLILGLLIYLLIIFTPLKKTVPGYGDISATKEFLMLKSKTENLEEEILSLQNYINANKNRILGNPKVTVQSEMIGKVYEPQTLDELDTIVTANQQDDVEDHHHDHDHEAIHYFYPPLNGKISGHFKKSARHFGIDILGPQHTPIAAIADGTIISAEYNMETGNTISIQHENNIISIYKHNSETLKAVGDFVHSGEAVAIIGNTGTQTDGYHVHFELWINGQPVDPLKYIHIDQ